MKAKAKWKPVKNGWIKDPPLKMVRCRKSDKWDGCALGWDGRWRYYRWKYKA